MAEDSKRFRLISADYEPDDLRAQLPCVGTLLRPIAGSDAPDYWLAALDSPLTWNDNGSARTVTHLVLAARYEGQSISPPIQRLVTGIAYVVDQSLLEDAQLNFDKCRYVAIGEIVGHKA
jgi:hypothetical protein